MIVAVFVLAALMVSGCGGSGANPGPALDRPAVTDLEDDATRRQFLAGLAAAGLLAGCGSDGSPKHLRRFRSRPSPAVSAPRGSGRRAPAADDLRPRRRGQSPDPAAALFDVKERLPRRAGARQPSRRPGRTGRGLDYSELVALRAGPLRVPWAIDTVVPKLLAAFTC